MKLGIRRWILFAVLVGLLCGMPEGASAQAQPGKLGEEQLGQLIASLGLKPTKVQQRYDFAFAAKMEGEEEWQLSMSAILSQDKEWVWVMAWLDELPASAADVPRTALLRLLAENDRLGNGKFFSYIPSNRRFVLQLAIPNEGLTAEEIKAILQDLGTSVVDTYPQWSVANWKQLETTPGAAVAPQTGSAPAATAR